ncbi:MAG: mechanosensitive ion channel [Chitinophagales bacterium]
MKDLLNHSFEFGKLHLTFGSVVLFTISLIISWIVVKLLTKLLYKTLNSRNVDSGKAFAITRIVKYLMYVIFFGISLQFLHLNLQGFLLGASALLIGVGIGLQQIFYDLFSGLLMLFERKVQVGDYIDIDGMVGRVDKIDMRTSVVRTMDNISVIVPNSKLISENVINWSHNRGLARFSVMVGVAYGSDTEKVKEVLIACAENVEKILNKPAPTVQFKTFADSTLNFKLLFWSRHFKEIESIKSDLHFSIDKEFRANKIVIAFPQMDVHLKRDY